MCGLGEQGEEMMLELRAMIKDLEQQRDDAIHSKESSERKVMQLEGEEG